MEAGTPPDRVSRDERPRPPRVFLSYAHDSDAHREAVRNLWVFLCANGVDARIDRVAAERAVVGAGRVEFGRVRASRV